MAAVDARSRRTLAFRARASIDERAREMHVGFRPAAKAAVARVRPLIRPRSPPPPARSRSVVMLVLASPAFASRSSSDRPRSRSLRSQAACASSALAARRAAPSFASAVFTAASASAPAARRAAPRAASAANAAPGASRGFAASASLASEASALEQQYAAPLRYLHWLIAAGTIGAFGFVQAAQRSKGADKANYMMLHKSLGLSVLVLTAPRLALRLATKIPAPVPGSAPEQFLAAAGHAAMYGFLIAMPATGFVMGYYGGKGLPFFGATIPGAVEKDGKLAGRAFKLHKQIGLYYEYFVPMHVGAVGLHALKGQNIMRRMGVTAFG